MKNEKQHGNIGNKNRVGKTKPEKQTPLPARAFPSEIKEWQEIAEQCKPKISFSGWVKEACREKAEKFYPK
jgi:hypothetical protein